MTTSPNTTVPKLSYDALIENEQDGKVSATLLGLRDFKSSGASKEEGLEKLIQLLQERKPEIVTLEIEPPQTENPWIKFAGRFKDDPQFDEVLAYIEEYRRELDEIRELR